MKRASHLDAIPPEAIDYATLQLLEDWRACDTTGDSAEIQAAEQDLAEFKRSMNALRDAAGESALYP